MTPQEPGSSLPSDGELQLQLCSIYCLYSPQNVLFSNSCPLCFQPMHTNYGSCRTRAPPSLCGSWRRESLLRILAPLHHNTHDVSTFHTHFSNNYQNLLDMHAPKLANHGAQDTRTRPLGAHKRPQLAASSPWKVHYSLFFAT